MLAVFAKVQISVRAPLTHPASLGPYFRIGLFSLVFWANTLVILIMGSIDPNLRNTSDWVLSALSNLASFFHLTQAHFLSTFRGSLFLRETGEELDLK